MRRPVFAALTLVAVLAMAGCGSSSGSGSQSATSQELSYFPTTSPLVATVATDPHSSAVKQSKALLARDPSAALFQTGLLTELARAGINYGQDIRPLFGNPAAFGVIGPTLSGSGSSTPFLLAWVTRSASALSRLVSKFGNVQPAGSYEGAKLYTGADLAVAVKGSTLLLSRSTPIIEQSLDRQASGSGFTSAEYARDTGGATSSALVTVAGDLTSALSSPASAQARRIPWVAAIRGYGVSIAAGASGTTIHFHIDTSGATLSPPELPIAAGSTPPTLAGPAPIEFGLHDLTQTIDFAEAAAQASSPVSYAKFSRQVAKLKRKTGFDLNALVAALGGDLQISSDGRSTIGRIAVTDPAAVSRMLADLITAPGVAFKPGTRIARVGNGLFQVTEPDGSRLELGLVGHELVLGKATVAEVRSFVAEPSTPAAGAAGALTFKVSLSELLSLTTHGQPLAGIEQQLVGQLGDLTGTATASPSGLNGTATESLK